MTERRQSTRRQWLAACAGAASTVPLAGCSGGTAGEDDGDGGGLLDGGDDGDGGEFERLPGWPMYGADRRNTGHRPETTGPTEGVTERWQFNPDTGNWPFTVAPAVLDGTVYIGVGDGKAWAIDADDGSEEWAANVGIVNQSPLAVDDTVYVPGTDRLTAIDRETGDTRWTETVEFRLLAPTFYDGDVLALMTSNEDSTLLRFDGDDGTSETLYRFAGVSGVPDSLALSGDVAYVAYEQVVEAIDVASGEQVWLWENPDEYSMQTPGVATDGTAVYATSPGGQEPSCYAIDAESGTERWQYVARDGDIHTSPSVAGSTVYVSGDVTVAVDAESGDQQWSTGQAGHTKPAVVDGAVYGRNEEGAHALDAESGDVLWTVGAGTGILAPPVVYDGLAYVVRAEASRLLAFESA